MLQDDGGRGGERIGHKRLRDDEGGDEGERDAIEGVESNYEAEKDTEGADEVEEEEAILGSDVDELEFEEELSSE